MNRKELLIRIERALANLTGRGQQAQLVEHDGTLAEDIFVRLGRTPDGKQCIAFGNLTGRSRVVRLVGRAETEQLQDVLSDEVVSPSQGKIRLSPWQVMLLWPR